VGACAEKAPIGAYSEESKPNRYNWDTYTGKTTPGHDVVASVIRHIVYVGSESIYDVELANGRQVRALRSNLTGRDQADLSCDAPVWLAWQACTPAVQLS
jgi:spermidine/putrescine transport system ATP-binding protein